MSITKTYVLYDSKCATCSRFIRALDSQGFQKHSQVIICSTVQGFIEASEILFDQQLLDQLAEKTILVSIAGQPYSYLTKSRAIATLLSLSSSAPYRISSKVITIIPKPLADVCYSIFSRLRRLLPVRECSLMALTNIQFHD
jgi:predicted DCC family thiol-disulfide oxidoreductase YuxK